MLCSYPSTRDGVYIIFWCSHCFFRYQSHGENLFWRSSPWSVGCSWQWYLLIFSPTFPIRPTHTAIIFLKIDSGITGLMLLTGPLFFPGFWWGTSSPVFSTLGVSPVSAMWFGRSAILSYTMSGRCFSYSAQISSIPGLFPFFRLYTALFYLCLLRPVLTRPTMACNNTIQKKRNFIAFEPQHTGNLGLWVRNPGVSLSTIHRAQAILKV